MGKMPRAMSMDRIRKQHPENEFPCWHHELLAQVAPQSHRNRYEMQCASMKV
jgi:hypothetical protein